MINVVCQCGAQLRLGDEWLGKKGRCPRCGHVILIANDGTRSQSSTPAGASVPARLRPERRTLRVVGGTVGVFLAFVVVAWAALQFWRSKSDRDSQEPLASARQGAPVDGPPAGQDLEPIIETTSTDRTAIDGPAPPPAQRTSSQSHEPDAKSARSNTNSEPSARSLDRHFGLTGSSTKFDDFHCSRIQSQCGFRLPTGAQLIEVDGKILPIQSIEALRNCRAPYLLLPKGSHEIRVRNGQPPIRVQIQDDFCGILREIRRYFVSAADASNEQLIERSARALDVFQSPFLLNQIGEDYLNRMEWEAAARSFRRALQTNPAYGPAHLNLAKCLGHQENREGARIELELAETFNIGNVFGIEDGIGQLRNAWKAHSVPGPQKGRLSLESYHTAEVLTEEDERVSAILGGIAKYAVEASERGKILSNLGIHFADTGRAELALDSFREALSALKSAGPERFEIAAKVFENMESTCRVARFVEADQYRQMRSMVRP